MRYSVNLLLVFLSLIFINPGQFHWDHQSLLQWKCGSDGCITLAYGFSPSFLCIGCCVSAPYTCVSCFNHNLMWRQLSRSYIFLITSMALLLWLSQQWLLYLELSIPKEVILYQTSVFQLSLFFIKVGGKKFLCRNINANCTVTVRYKKSVWSCKYVQKKITAENNFTVKWVIKRS